MKTTRAAVALAAAAVTVAAAACGHHLNAHDHVYGGLYAAGVSTVKVVQRMLGHASAAMTLDVYADLFDSDLDHVADKLENVLTSCSRAPGKLQSDRSLTL